MRALMPIVVVLVLLLCVVAAVADDTPQFAGQLVGSWSSQPLNFAVAYRFAETNDVSWWLQGMYVNDHDAAGLGVAGTYNGSIPMVSNIASGAGWCALYIPSSGEVIGRFYVVRTLVSF